MPFVQAVLLETFRVASITFSGVPRYSTADIQLKDGTTIPKDTIVVSNSYQIMHDSSYWKHPDKFMPERFLDEAGAFHTDDRMIHFGTGRRYCPGQSLAEKEFFFFFTSILQKFKVFPVPGQTLPNHGIDDVPVSSTCLLYTSPSPRDLSTSRMPSSA